MTIQYTHQDDEMTVVAASVWLDDWSQHLKSRGISQMQAGSKRHLKDVATQIETLAKRYAPKKTGALVRSITSKVEQTATGWEAEVTAGGPNVPYAPAQEFGTQPYVIRPKKAGGVLVFKKGAKTIFAREVNHPGVKPQRYMAKAAERFMEGTVAAIADESVAKVFTSGDPMRQGYRKRMGMPPETGGEAR